MTGHSIVAELGRRAERFGSSTSSVGIIFFRRYYRSRIGHLRTQTATAIYSLRLEGNHRHEVPTLAGRSWGVQFVDRWPLL